MNTLDHCICCGAPARYSELLFPKKNISYMRCAKCTFVYQDVQPVYEEREDIYDGIHYHERFIETESVYLSTAGIYLHTMNGELRRAGLFPDKSKCRLLDVGCGIGYFLSLAKKDGYDVRGADISKWVAEYVKEHHDIEVYSGNFPEMDIPAESFDIITMWQVIEHLPEPNLFLEKIFRLLKPGGLVVMATPDVDNPVARAYGRNWNCYMPDEHLGLFSIRSMDFILKKNGFRPLVVRSINDRKFVPEQLGYLRFFAVRVAKNVVLKTKVLKPAVPGKLLQKWESQQDLEIPLPSISYSVFAIGKKS